MLRKNLRLRLDESCWTYISWMQVFLIAVGGMCVVQDRNQLVGVRARWWHPVTLLIYAISVAIHISVGVWGVLCELEAPWRLPEDVSGKSVSYNNSMRMLLKLERK